MPKARNQTVILPSKARKLASEALAVRRTLPASRRYGTQVGISMAGRIAAGLPVNAVKVWSYLTRARPVVLRSRKLGKTARTSKAIGAWDLWGGSAAYAYLRNHPARR